MAKKKSRPKKAKSTGKGLGIKVREILTGKTVAQRKAEAKEEREAKARQARTFKTIVSKLKKLGVVDRRTDARKVRPGESRALDAKVSKFGTVALHNGKAVKVPKAMRDKARAGGVETFGNKIIVPRAHKGDRVKVVGDQIVRTAKGPGGTKIKSVVTLERAKDIESFLEKEAARLEAEEKDKNKFYAFRIGGNNSYAIFESIDELKAYLRQYVKSREREESIEDLLGEGILEEITVEGEDARFRWEQDAQARKAERHEYIADKNRRRRERNQSRRALLKGRR